MKSKTSFFNSTIFFNLYKRFWPIFVGYIAIWVIALPVSLQNTLRYAVEQAQYSENPVDITIRAAEQVMSVSFYGGVVMSAVFAILIAMAAYSYLYNARSVSMMCSLPIKREGVFLTVTMAGLIAMLVSNVVVFLITAAVEAAFGALSVTYLLQGLGAICLMNLFFLGFAALCASFTGHILVLPAVYVVLNFTVAGVEVFVRLVLRALLYGFNEVYVCNFAVFSPIIGLVTRASAGRNVEYLADGSSVTTGFFYGDWTLMIVYGIVGIVFALCAMLLIKHRRMETASDVVAVKPLKPIFKYCMCIGCALVLGTAVYYAVFDGGWLFGSGNGNINGIESMSYMLLFMLIGAFVGYFAADMLMKKTLRVFESKNWIGFIITAALIAALVIGAEFDVFGYERAVPELGEVEEVVVQCNGEPVVLSEEENIELTRQLHASIISHKNENEALEQSRQFYDYYYLTINYSLKNGKLVMREYSIYIPDENGNDDIFALTDIMNTDEAIASRKSVEIPVKESTLSYAGVNLFDGNAGEYLDYNLTAAQMQELYETCILPDMKEKTLGKIWYITDESFLDYVCDADINFELRQRVIDERGLYSYKYDYFSTTVTMGATRTKEWLEENLGVKLIPQSESSKIQEQNMSPEEREKYGYDVAVNAPAVEAVEVMG